MPKVKFPTNLKGWLIGLAASAVGFVAGTLALSFLGKVFR